MHGENEAKMTPVGRKRGWRAANPILPRGLRGMLPYLAIAAGVCMLGVGLFLWNLSPSRSQARLARLLAVGMTRSEVRAALGQPASVTSAAEVETRYHIKIEVAAGGEVWIYPLRNLGLQILFVVLDEEGRVTSYQID